MISHSSTASREVQDNSKAQRSLSFLNRIQHQMANVEKKTEAVRKLREEVEALRKLEEEERKLERDKTRFLKEQRRDRDRSRDRDRDRDRDKSRRHSRSHRRTDDEIRKEKSPSAGEARGTLKLRKVQSPPRNLYREEPGDAEETGSQQVERHRDQHQGHHWKSNIWEPQ